MTRWCHCRSCRRNSGAAVLTFAGFASDRFSYLKGEPQRFQSSPGVWRSFCARCGTPLTYEADRYGPEVHVTIGTFDHPESLQPTVHVWTAERIPWLHIDDELPRYRATPRGGADPER